jgi:hypothetical protein
VVFFFLLEVSSIRPVALVGRQKAT